MSILSRSAVALLTASAPIALGAERAPPIVPGAPAVASVAPGRGLTIRAADDSSAMTIRARLQMRDTFSVADETSNEIGIKTVRLVAHGHLFSPDLRYFVQLAFGAGDFESFTPSPVFDAYLEYALHRDLQLRAGQYFVPFDRARTTREYALELVDRAQVVTELNLDRDVGLTLFSRDLFGTGGRLGYELGVFGGAGKNRFGPRPLGFLCVGRIVSRPLGPFDDDTEGDLERLPKPRLAIGIAAAYNRKTHRQRSTTGPILVLDGFNYRHAAGDVVFKYAGFSFLGEVVYRRARSSFHESMVDGEPVREWSRSGWGYLAQAGMMLTSKLELAGRWDQLRSLDETDPTLVALAHDQGKELGGGVNLYFNGHLLKLQADYAARFGAADPVHLARLQLDATF